MRDSPAESVAATVRTVNIDVIVTDGPHRGETGRVAGDRYDDVLIYVYDRLGRLDGEMIAVPESQLAIYPDRKTLWQENQRLRRQLER